MASSGTSAPPSSFSPSSPPSSTLSEHGQAQSSQGCGYQRYQGSSSSLTRSCALLCRLRDECWLHYLNDNSLGLLAVASVRANALPFSLFLIRSMLRSGYLPHAKAWSAIVARLASSPYDDPTIALHLFDSILRRLRRLLSPLSSDARPDTAALKACANLGDIPRFLHMFGKMPWFGVEPGILMHNVLIKLCARAERRDLLAHVLDQIVRAGLVPCITTLHSLATAYVGLGDLETTEKLVQVMREDRDDIPLILRSTNHVDNVFNKFPGEVH